MLAKFVALGDSDGGGKADLVAVWICSHDICNAPASQENSKFGTKVDFTTGSNPSSVAIGDIDGDSKLDLTSILMVAYSCFFFHNASTIGSLVSGGFCC
jgi:hypothetical protein